MVITTSVFIVAACQEPSIWAQGKKADLTARLGPALEAEAAERERLREEEEKARLEEEERQRQLQLELELKEEAENADEGTPAAEAEQNGGDEEDYQEQYTEGGDTEGGTGSALAEETPGKSEVRLLARAEREGSHVWAAAP